MTAAIWAIEGAGVFWLATRAEEPDRQLFGLAMHCFAASAFINGLRWWVRRAGMHRPLPTLDFIGHAMLALGALLISWWSHGLLQRVG